MLHGLMFDWLTEQISGSAISYLIVLIAAGSDVLFPLIPSETIVITAGVVASRGDLHVWLLIPITAIGAMLGDNLVYLLGRKVGDPLLRSILRGEAGRGQLRWAEQAIRSHGALFIVVGRFIPGGRTVSTLAAGTLELPWRRFLVADAIAALLWSTYAVLLGYIGGSAFRDNLWQPLLFSLSAAAVVALALEAWRRLQKRRGRDILGHALTPEDEADPPARAATPPGAGA